MDGPVPGEPKEALTNGTSLLSSSDVLEHFEDEGPLPRGDAVYLRCGIDHFQKNVPSTRALTIRGGDGLSVEWSKYTSFNETLSRNLKPGKTAADFRVAAANVGQLLEARDMTDGSALFKEVKHDPIQPAAPFGPNRAHSLIVPVASNPMHDKKTGALLKDREFKDVALAVLKELFRPA